MSWLPVLDKVLDRVIPDKSSRDKAKNELAMLRENGELEAMRLEFQALNAQAEINKADAQSGNWWQSGWRPAAGWICVAGMGYSYLLQPLLPWALQVLSKLAGSSITVPVLPDIQSGELMALMFSLLGVAGIRSFDKIKGVAK